MCRQNEVKWVLSGNKTALRKVEMQSHKQENNSTA